MVRNQGQDSATEWTRTILPGWSFKLCCFRYSSVWIKCCDKRALVWWLGFIRMAEYIPSTAGGHKIYFAIRINPSHHTKSLLSQRFIHTEEYRKQQSLNDHPGTLCGSIQRRNLVHDFGPLWSFRNARPLLHLHISSNLIGGIRLVGFYSPLARLASAETLI
ncbi:hypothetical protein CDAR_592431 [Caerostris darwini]|uniref:Uncharacterized protein n=1 Tax=Caerostris darwini TaxID=1538125 RepID=A0AAV4V8V7_9ARAC|nr:hypothetical protein CDAR_592431 [Caerostris darwini]